MGQQLWAVSSLGGYLSNNVLSKQIRHAAQPLIAQTKGKSQRA